MFLLVDNYNYCFSEISEMLPGILNQLGAESLSSLKKLAHTVAGGEYFRKYRDLV